MFAKARYLTIVWMLLAGLSACSVPDIAEGDLEVMSGPAPADATTATVRFVMEEPSTAVVTAVDESGHGTRVTSPELDAGNAEVTVFGLDPGTEYTVSVEIPGRTGKTTLRTGELPEDLPPITVTSDPSQMEPGLTLFDAIPLGAGTGDNATDDGYLIAVDADGRIVWYYRQTHSIQDVRRTATGELLFINFETGAKLLDPSTGAVVEWAGTTALETAPRDSHGRPYAGTAAISVETDQMHHEIIELPNGNYMTLSRELRRIEGYPEAICEGDEFDGSYNVGADTIVEFDPATGQTISEWSLFDFVDPLDELDLVVPAEFCGGYLERVYPDEDARDWTHANAVILDEPGNAVLVSVRHLDQIVAIRYADDEAGDAGELLWRLGRGGDFALEEGEWFLHQHSPQLLPDGSILLYDNGNQRPGTSLTDPQNLPYSRAARYTVDVDTMTATQVWEHRLDTPDMAVYAPFVGDADHLAGGNVLITHGGQLDPPAHSPQAEGVLGWGEIIEVAPDTGDVLFDLHMKDATRSQGWVIYRAERIPSLYPTGYVVEQV